MKNIIMLQKFEDGKLYCQQITQKGKKYVNTERKNPGYWEEGGTITFDEIEEILDKQV